MGTTAEKFILSAMGAKITSENQFKRFQRQFSRDNKVPFLTNDALLEAYHNLRAKKTIKRSAWLEQQLTLKSTRSLSGIVVVTVLTKPYECPGSCLYCPSEKNVPKSYFSSEPAVMRAICCEYDPFRQVIARLEALKAVGHLTEKVNIRIVGGTWSYYPKRYRTWFVKELFRAANNRSVILNEVKNLKDPSAKPQDDNARSLDLLQKTNETALHRIVEISIETRQDYIDIDEIKRMRKLGITKVELGVQSLYDKVLQINRRGHVTADTITATKLLKDAGFKVSYQMMLNLPGSDIKQDLAMFEQLFANPDFQPDHLKIYPLALVKEADVFKLYKEGLFKPYSADQLIELITKIKQYIPYYCRIERVIRDIPADLIVEGGAKVSNLRQEVFKALGRERQTCNCIRCREIKGAFLNRLDVGMFRQDYDSADGKEIFLSIETKDRKNLISLLRLRIPSQYFVKRAHFISALDDAAIIREIHTYGPQVVIGKKSKNSPQHQGFGRQLVNEAERIAKGEYGLSKMAVIAGVGVREYFRALGYCLENSYMIRDLGDN